MRLSARNQLKGKIIDLKSGPIATRVRVDVGAGTLVTATILSESAEDLTLSVGDTVTVIIKATDVMIGK